MAVEVPKVLKPSEAAALLGLPVRTLSLLIREKGYPFTSLAPNGRPGLRGVSSWGLTAAQLAAIVEGQQERFTPRPEAGQTKPRADAVPRWTPPGGKSRLKHKRPPEGG